MNTSRSAVTATLSAVVLVALGLVTYRKLAPPPSAPRAPGVRRQQPRGGAHAAQSWPSYSIRDVNPPDARYSTATGVNAAGQVSGYTMRTGDPTVQAFLW